ncbi:hypothetical protein DOTSEDRAFT_23404 [Dothistroma septosporum NZE10]|uniref:Uncharacterized protein n=1 Tax=Dothistroma septosporum (strain NZE10 / CBS 128990) TaxID=675120 RepID=N1PR05_DOTSN|nr:hypothetical protein DOTSEDRAFT_23404 [Dothistroma septosporum NZE10]
MLTFDPPIEVSSSQTTTAAAAEAAQNRLTHDANISTLTTTRPPSPALKPSSRLTLVEVESLKDTNDGIIADIQNEGFSVATTNQILLRLQSPYKHKRPVIPPEHVHLGEVMLIAFLMPESLQENRIKSMGLGPAYAPPVSDSTKPSLSDVQAVAKSRKAEPRRRTALPPSQKWKRSGSTYHFVDDDEVGI